MSTMLGYEKNKIIQPSLWFKYSEIGLVKLLFLSFTFVLFLDMPGYWFAAGVLSQPPLYFVEVIILCFLLSVIFYFNIVLSRSIIYWAFFFLSVTFLWILFVGNFEVDTKKAVNSKILSFLLLLSVNYIFVKSYETLKLFRKFLVLAVLIIVTLNILEALDIYALFQKGSLFRIDGRTAAFYINPNKTGFAIILGVILSITAVSVKLRNIYIILAFVGILLTGSRGALLTYTVVILGFLWFNMISKKRFLLILAGLVFAIVSSIPLMLDYLYTSDISFIKQLESRTVAFSSGGEVKDFSTQERMKVAREAWYLFQENPVLGHGINTKIGNMEVGTHNIYLDLLVDHGIIGLLIVPLFLLLLYLESSGFMKETIIIFSGAVMLWGFFSHNILEEYYIIISFATIAAIATHSNNFEKSNINKLQV